jgi:predicted phosphodiesterase
LTKTRVIIPDSHGNHIDLRAEAVFLDDLKALDPDEIVMIGDHLDCGGTFNGHQLNYTTEMEESYEDDVNACNSFIDAIQKRAPRARIHYIEGNHEAHVARWAARNSRNKRDADFFADRLGPVKALGLKDRGITYYKTEETYQGLTVPGTIKLGKCFFTHGISHSKAADAVHLKRFGASVVFGHVHRSMSVVERTVTSEGHGAWCPGTLAKLQPLYRHTSPTDWTHGYGVQFFNPSGLFTHLNVPIFAAAKSSGLEMFARGMAGKSAKMAARKRAA